MAPDPIGVGIIGASPGRGWASVSHIPALATLPQYELRAVATSRRESAAAARQAFGVPGFDDHAALIGHPGIDLVVVSVKAPAHRGPVLAALEAGKHVYCDWPLGNDLDEAAQMADVARRRQVRTVVGLQARASPAINRVRDLVAQGYVGKVLSTSIVASCWVYGESIAADLAFMVMDKRSGSNLLTIQVAHLVDAMCWCLGEFGALTASAAIVRPEVRIAESDQRIAVATPDQIAVSGILESGAMASIHLRGGRSRGTNLLWEINGTEGDLVVTGPGSHVSNDDEGAPALRGARGGDAELAPLPIPDSYRWAPTATPEGPPFNIAQLYSQFAADIRNGTSLAPTFDAAVRRHRMIDAIETAADTGMRQTYAMT